MAERSIDEVVDDWERAARRLRPFLVAGLILVFASLIGSAVVLNHWLNVAEAETEKARQQLAQSEALREVLERQVAEASGPRRAALEESLQQASEAAAPERPPQVPLDRLEVDIFICAESPRANRDHAIALRARRPASAQRDWERRYVSAERNAQPNYRLVRNEIRYNPDEEDAADALLTTIRDELGADAAKVLTFFPSPNTLSVFFCDGAVPPPAGRNQA